MASGKSLELVKIKRKPASRICICGEPWNDHLRKDGQVFAKFQNEKHSVPPAAPSGWPRHARRRMMRGGSRG